MLIAVAGSSGLGQVVGVASTRPAALLEAVAADPSSHVIAMAPWHLAAAVREQAHVLIAARPDVRVCVLAPKHHALTLTLLGAVALEQRDTPDGWSEPGGAVQMITEAAAASRSIVWFPRAWGLEQPEASFGQRASSLFTPRGFFAEAGAAGLVEGRAGLTPTLNEVLCSAAEPPALLRAQLGSAACSTVGVTVEAGAPYATKDSVELTGLVRPSRRPVLGAPCGSCSARRSAAECYFCGCGPHTGSTSAKQLSSTDRTEQTIYLGGTAA